MADLRFDEFVSSPEISRISNVDKEKNCDCCLKLKQELNVTLQDLS